MSGSDWLPVPPIHLAGVFKNIIILVIKFFERQQITRHKEIFKFLILLNRHATGREVPVSLR